MSKQVGYLILFNARTFWLSCQPVAVNRCCFSLFLVFVYFLTKWNTATIPKVQLWLLFVRWMPLSNAIWRSYDSREFHVLVYPEMMPTKMTHSLGNTRSSLQTQRRLSWTKNGGRCFSRPSIKGTCLGLLPMKPMLFLNGMLTSVVVVWIY